jgi:branched-chain amino acid transport system substrate-binding protein
MGDPAEYWYGPGWLRFAAHLRDTGQWKPRNNKIALIAGSSDYSITIIKAAEQTAADFGWDIVIGPEIVKTPTTEWGPVLAKLREADPALLLHSHLAAGDIAQFMRQFRQDPTQTLIYFPWGPLQAAFREIGGADVEGVIGSTVMGLLEDDMGRSFQSAYDKRYDLDPGGTGAISGCVPYGLLHHYAVAAAVAGGTGEPGDYEQNRRISQVLKRFPFRTVFGSIKYHPEWQSAVPYPDLEENDPSLGMPHLFYQVQDHTQQPKLIAPVPYDANDFQLPTWLS